MFLKQDPMRRVLYSLTPILLWSVYLYGWRVIALTAFVFLVGILTEYVFEKSRGKKTSEAVLVTCALFALSLPPAVPLWVAAVGIFFAVFFGKEVYGGFGRNLYNPAITGRTFAYISFPLMMQTTWMLPGNFGLGGVNHQVQGLLWPEAVFMLILAAAVFFVVTRSDGNKKTLITVLVTAVVLTVAFYVGTAYAGLRQASSAWNEVDVLTTATPLEIFKGLAQQTHWQPKTGWEYLQDNSLFNLFFGFRVGSIGEGAIFLILLAAVYLLWTKTANWRPLVWTVLSAAIVTAVLYYTGVLGSRFPQLTPKSDWTGQFSDIVKFLMSGSLLFAAVFMATDPVSSPKKPLAQHLYGIIIGSLTIVIRAFAGFPEGVSFAILTANTFASLIDEALPAKKKKAGTVTKSGSVTKAAPAAEGGAE